MANNNDNLRDPNDSEISIIWQHLWENMAEDDRSPNEVLEDIYKGDKVAYCKVMAKYAGIDLSKP